KVEKFVYSHLNQLAREKTVAVIKFFMDPMATNPAFSYNTLTDYGFLDTSSTDGLVDLRKDSLREGIRKGHWYDIQRILKNNEFSIHIMDHTHADVAIHEEYRRLHRL